MIEFICWFVMHRSEAIATFPISDPIHVTITLPAGRILLLKRLYPITDNPLSEPIENLL